MANLGEWLLQPWPWYVAGPLIGLVVPALLLLGNRAFGVSSNLRHACAVIRVPHSYFRYDWRAQGAWNLLFAAGIVLGGAIAATLLASPEPLRVAGATQRDLAALGLAAGGGTATGLAPAAIFGVAALADVGTVLYLALGGFLVGFGARYAGGCTSGHAITGLAHLQPASLVAVMGFFIGGLATTWLVLPLVLPL